ncbi:MAG TPA: CcmD family protein [Candidatus Binataceae bacterium]|nr:CcmD family protein [Candidatus Binataceae bacterium]
MEHFDYLFAAYSIIFAVIFAYVVFIQRRQSRMDAEIRAMEERLKTLKTPAQSSNPKIAAEN